MHVASGRKLEAIRVDWLPVVPGIPVRFEGFLSNPSTGGEGGWIAASSGDYIVREGDYSWVIAQAEFAREWSDPVEDQARADANAARAETEAAKATADEEARKARELADAKRIFDEKRDAEKRARDGSEA